MSVTNEELIELKVLAKMCGSKYDIILYKEWGDGAWQPNIIKIIIYPGDNFEAYSDMKNAADIKKFNSIDEVKEVILNG